MTKSGSEMTGLIEVEDLRKKYDSTEVVKGISFELKPGEIVGYLGPNGAGKSTTIKMLSGFIHQSSGHIRYNGQSIHDDLNGYKKRIGYLPERPDLFEFLGGYEYLEMIALLRGLPRSGISTHIEELLSLFGMNDAAHYSIGSYSKGMRQKILILSSIIHDPPILFFDEPKSGLDVFSISILEDLIRLMAQSGKIILYSTHQLDSVLPLCNRVIVLHQGRIHIDIETSKLKTALSGKGLDSLFREEIYEQNTMKLAEQILNRIKGK